MVSSDPPDLQPVPWQTRTLRLWGIALYLLTLIYLYLHAGKEARFNSLLQVSRPVGVADIIDGTLSREFLGQTAWRFETRSDHDGIGFVKIFIGSIMKLLPNSPHAIFRDTGYFHIIFHLYACFSQPHDQVESQGARDVPGDARQHFQDSDFPAGLNKELGNFASYHAPANYNYRIAHFLLTRKDILSEDNVW